MPRDPNRIEPILNLISVIWHKHPDFRLGQLLVNMNPSDTDLFYVEDNLLVEEMLTYITETEQSEFAEEIDTLKNILGG
jgi:uncharacterized protein YihD (DUF1040 family)